MNSRKSPHQVFISSYLDEGIKEALTKDAVQRYNREVRDSAGVESSPFSEEFENRIHRMLPMANHSYLSLRKHTLRRAAVVAAMLVLIFSASAVVLAITVPQIQYMIQRGSVSWDILFHQENPEDADPEEFTSLMPSIPEGYHIEEKTEFPGVFRLILRDSHGNEIEYNQLDAKSAGVTLDAEGEYIEERTRGDNHYIIQSDGETVTFTFDNGYYVFLLKGKCDAEILKEMMDEIIDHG